MPNLISVKIDRKLVDRSRVFTGKARADGSIPEYYDFVLIPRKEPGRFGDTHMVKQQATKAEREQGVQLPILGSATERGEQAPQQSPQRPAPTPPPQDNIDEDVPF